MNELLLRYTLYFLITNVCRVHEYADVIQREPNNRVLLERLANPRKLK